MMSRSALRRTVMGVALMIVMAVVLVVGVAGAAVAGPRLLIDAASNTTAAPGGQFDYFVQITNVGDADTDGSEIKVVVTLPPGLSAVVTDPGGEAGTGNFTCRGPGGNPDITGASVVTCATTSVVTTPQNNASNHVAGFALTVAADNAASGVLTSSFALSGGGADPQSTVASTTLTADPPAFGVSAFDSQLTKDATGSPFTQAGGHPYEMSTSMDFDTTTNPNPLIGALSPVEPAKDVLVDLPPGLVGNPTGVAQCNLGDLANTQLATAMPLCPPASQVGTTMVRVNNLAASLFELGPIPVFNLVPPPNVPAEFGFNVDGTVVTLQAQLRSATDYGVSVNVAGISEGLAVAGSRFTLWGVPGDPSHDPERVCPGREAPWEGGPPASSVDCPSQVSGAALPQLAFLRYPTSCTAPGVGLTTAAHLDSWVHPGVFKTYSFVWHNPPAYPSPPGDWGAAQGPTGCERVPFDPTLKATPATPARAGAPDGLDVDVDLPQSNDPSATGEADLKKAVVALPAGVRIDPSAGGGLAGCSSVQIALHSSQEQSCPEASKIGTVQVETPLLEKPLTGAVYAASPHDNPFGSLLATYIVVRGPGVLVKLPGEIAADPVTGQLTITFDSLPQLPFSHLHVELSGGPRAPLALPPACGTYTTHALLTGWNGSTVTSDSHFTVTEGPNGGACPTGSFTPSLTAGTTNPVAGAFSPFGLRLTRTDADSEFNALSLNLPPGLLADLSSVPVRCSDAQAAAAACPADSHIGTVTVGAGAGSNPFYVNGDVYLTGPYKGGPFGLAAVVRAQAGPFDLGYVVVRASLQVHDDGSVTATTDPFPTILQGIPLQVRDIRVSVDRAHFILNPTNCTAMSVGGTVSSTDGQTAPLASRFQVGECAALGFHPSFKVATAARTSKANGASLDVKVGSGAGQANIAKTVVTLPKQLPARLTTIQQACLAATFAANPATCPAGSNIGIATATTPILASPVTGPAYLVSHGGAAFPDVVLVLQGEGVTVHLTGGVNIRKGITTTSFNSIPDVPIGTFELRLPTGPHSGLGSNLPAKARGSMCGQNLVMPTVMTGQNGAVVKQNTKIAVTGCPRAKKKKHAKGGKGHKK